MPIEVQSRTWTAGGRLGALVLLVLLGLGSSAESQVRISGTLTDAVTGEPLYYAHLLIRDTFRGASTNSEGAFAIEAESLPTYLVLSYIGYRQDTLLVEQAEVHLTMRPATVRLPELEVDASQAERIVKLAYKRCRDARKDRRWMEAFTRQFTTSDTTHTELIEAFQIARVSCDGIADWGVLNGRYALHERYLEADYVYHRDLSEVIERIRTAQRSVDPVIRAYLPINPKPANRFRLNLVEWTRDQGRELAVIAFHPHSNARPAFRGKLYIDATSGDLYRIEAEVQHRNFAPLHSTSTFPGQRLEHQSFKYVMAFRRSGSGMVPTSLQLDIAYEHYKPRHFRRMVSVNSNVVFYSEVEQPSKKGRNKARWESDYDAIDRTDYDPDFWASNAVLQQNPLEASITAAFESSGSFGNAFSNRRRPADFSPRRR